MSVLTNQGESRAGGLCRVRTAGPWPPTTTQSPPESTPGALPASRAGDMAETFGSGSLNRDSQSCCFSTAVSGESRICAHISKARAYRHAGSSQNAFLSRSSQQAEEASRLAHTLAQRARARPGGGRGGREAPLRPCQSCPPSLL